MNPSYSNCAFKLYLPKCTVFEDHLKISYKFDYRKENAEKLMFYEAVVIDKFRQNHKNTDGVKLFPPKYMPQPATILFNYVNGKRIFVTGAQLKMSFLSDNGERTDVLFQIINSEQSKLLDVAKSPMSSEEKEFYTREYFACANNGTSGAEGTEHKPESVTRGNTNTYSDEINATDLPGLEKYRNALKAEKLFLMHEGGRQYKVTNGKLISNVKGTYSYIFDLETELHISDDAPINILLEG